MRSARPLAAAAALCAAVVAGCGLGPGDETGTAELTITRDYGASELEASSPNLRESDTVMRVLDRSAGIETRFGGGFVQSIAGIDGAVQGGRSSDWFFFVNGIESSVGATSFKARDGDRVWWDYRDWTDALRTPAVVGSWPEPFVHGYDGDRWDPVVACAFEEHGSPADACAQVAASAGEAGIGAPRAVDATDDAAQPDSGAVRILVGPWEQIRQDEDAGLLADGPDRSGVFARFAGTGDGTRLELLDERAEVAETLGPGAGLVAALRPEDRPPTWVVTGTDVKGVAAAASLLGNELRNRYAVASAGVAPIPVPIP